MVLADPLPGGHASPAHSTSAQTTGHLNASSPQAGKGTRGRGLGWASDGLGGFPMLAAAAWFNGFIGR